MGCVLAAETSAGDKAIQINYYYYFKRRKGDEKVMAIKQPCILSLCFDLPMCKLFGAEIGVFVDIYGTSHIVSIA